MEIITDMDDEHTCHIFTLTSFHFHTKYFSSEKCCMLCLRSDTTLSVAGGILLDVHRGFRYVPFPSPSVRGWNLKMHA